MSPIPIPIQCAVPNCAAGSLAGSRYCQYHDEQGIFGAVADAANELRNIPEHPMNPKNMRAPDVMFAPAKIISKSILNSDGTVTKIKYDIGSDGVVKETRSIESPTLQGSNPGEVIFDEIGELLKEKLPVPPYRALWDIRAPDKEIDAPPHYTKGHIECWDFIVDQDLNFLAGNVIKYICRYRHKGTPLKDLQKAKAYLEKLIDELDE